MSTVEDDSSSWDTAARNFTELRNAPRKNKIVLMVLEILPLCGPLGIDRFYLGSTFTGLAKLTVCVCTCLVGGLIWGLFDAVIVIANSLSRESSIDAFGMVAEFDEEHIEASFILAIFAIVL